jgi:hypothetical protein
VIVSFVLDKSHITTAVDTCELGVRIFLLLNNQCGDWRGKRIDRLKLIDEIEEVIQLPNLFERR